MKRKEVRDKNPNLLLTSDEEIGNHSPLPHPASDKPRTGSWSLEGPATFFYHS